MYSIARILYTNYKDPKFGLLVNYVMSSFNDIGELFVNTLGARSLAGHFLCVNALL